MKGNNTQTPVETGSALWLKFIASPLIWLTYLITSYALLPWACRWQSHVPLMATALIALSATLGCAFHARTLYRVSKPLTGTGSKRDRLLARWSLWLSVLFVLLIAAHGIANLLVDPCRLEPAPASASRNLAGVFELPR